MASNYNVKLLREGCQIHNSDNSVIRKCNTVLINGPSGLFLINPGSIWDGPSLIQSLKSAGVKEPENDVTCVVCTDGRAENVGCLGLFSCADLMIVGYDIQKRGDLFIQHDFCDTSVPYEFDDNLSIIGTPAQRDQQVSVIVNGHLTSKIDQMDPSEGEEEVCKIAITGNLFTDKSDASRVSFFDTLGGSHGDNGRDKETSVKCWRNSRQYILNSADWIIPAYGEAFKGTLSLAITCGIARNFKRPESSILGRYVNRFHFAKHVFLEKAAVDHCNLSPGQVALEIGFGPGYGLQFAVEQVAPLTAEYIRNQSYWRRLLRCPARLPDHINSDGSVIGVDISEYMVQKARSRTSAYIQAGKVSVHNLSVDHLPMMAESVDACFHVDCFYYWPSLSYSLSRIWRVLKPDSHLVTVFYPDQLKTAAQRGWFRYGRADPVAYVLALESSGFDRIEWHRSCKPEGSSMKPYDAIVARKPPTLLLSVSKDSCTQGPTSA